MSKLTMLAAGAAGYVLGARAGRERYEQIKNTAMRVKDNPTVQDKARQAADMAREQAPVVKDRLSDAASATASKVTGSGNDDLVDQLHPASTARQDNPGPQGDLP